MQLHNRTGQNKASLNFKKRYKNTKRTRIGKQDKLSKILRMMNVIQANIYRVSAGLFLTISRFSRLFLTIFKLFSRFSGKYIASFQGFQFNYIS